MFVTKKRWESEKAELNRQIRDSQNELREANRKLAVLTAQFTAVLRYQNFRIDFVTAIPASYKVEVVKNGN